MNQIRGQVQLLLRDQLQIKLQLSVHKPHLEVHHLGKKQVGKILILKKIKTLIFKSRSR